MKAKKLREKKQQSLGQKSPRSTTNKISNNNPILCTSLDVLRWFLPGNSDQLSKSALDRLLGASRSKNVATLRKVVDELDCPQMYDNPETYQAVAQICGLISKVPFPYGGGDAERKATALDKFFASEKRCRIVSKKLEHYNTYPNREDPTMRVLISRARSKVDSVLGSIERALPSILERGRFGPGMTVCSTDSSRTGLAFKLAPGERTVTGSCRPYAAYAFLSDPLWVRDNAQVDITAGTVSLGWRTVSNCRLTFVPKDERSFRTIAIEPYGNVFIQLGVHEFLVERLRKRAGVDITHGQSYHRHLAKLGSVDGSLATLDLSSASDCVSKGLMTRLVRPAWLGFLDDIRSKHYELNGTIRSFDKWSSMGNGYTFALETLLFWALAQTCEEYCASNNRASCYGDDIIVSKESALLVVQLLRYCGFSINLKKSFITGPFRESCGGDYHSGVPVRPTFLRSHDLKLSDVFRVLNTLGRARRGVDSRDLKLKLWELIPPKLRFCGPLSEAEGSYLWISDTDSMKLGDGMRRYDPEIQCNTFLHLVVKPQKGHVAESGRYLAWHFSARSRSVLSDRTLTVARRGRYKYRLGRTPIPLRGWVDRDSFLLGS